MVLALRPWTAIIKFMVLAVYRLMDGHNHMYGLIVLSFMDGHNLIYGLSILRLTNGHNHIYGLGDLSSHGRL